MRPPADQGQTWQAADQSPEQPETLTDTAHTEVHHALSRVPVLEVLNVTSLGHSAKGPIYSLADVNLASDVAATPFWQEQQETAGPAQRVDGGRGDKADSTRASVLPSPRYPSLARLTTRPGM